MDRRGPSARASTAAATKATANWSKPLIARSLIQVAQVARAMHRGRMPPDQGWVVAKGSAVDIAANPFHVAPCRC